MPTTACWMSAIFLVFFSCFATSKSLKTKRHKPTNVRASATMRISFDLDQTLIPIGNEFETEKRNLFQKLFRVERIRKGTINLFKELKSKGHKLSIYTTSYREPYKIRFSFLTYGLRLEQIVNEKKNRKELSHKNIRPQNIHLRLNLISI